MIVQLSLYVAVYIIAGVIAGILGWYTWKRRTMPGGLYFSLLMAMLSEWAFMDAFKAAAIDSGSMVLYMNLSYVGIVSVPPLWLMFTLAYSRRSHWLTPGLKMILCAMPVISVGLIVTNDLHGLIWSSITPVSGPHGLYLTYAYGPWYLFHATYSYLLMFSGILLLLSVLPHSYEKHRSQTAILLLGTIVPLVFNVIYIAGLSPLEDLDLSPIAFCFTGVLFAWGIFRYQLFDILPVAREALITNMAEGVMVLDRDGLIIDLNPAARKLLQTGESAIWQPVGQVMARYPELVECCQQGGCTSPEILIKDDTGSRWIDVHVSVLRDAGGELNGKVVALWDITRRKLIEEELKRSNDHLQLEVEEREKIEGELRQNYRELSEKERELLESEDRWRRLVEYIPASIALYREGKLIYVNESAVKLIGANSAGELLGRPVLSFVHPAYHDVAIGRFRQMGEKHLPAEPVEEKYLRLDGRVVNVEVMTMPITYLGKESLLSVIWNIDERKRAEEALAVSLREKELLLKEIHHRVKNNLQIISSLLSLQTVNPKNESASALLTESQNRIKSMALIHEKLYQSRDLARIDFREYVQSLIGSLTRSYISNPGLKIEVSIEDVSLDIDTAIPCGLIINELITNSLKYAFTDGRAGRIGVSLSQDGDQYSLVVSDDGVGLPPGLDFRNTLSLGMQLVVTLTDQLNGHIERLEGKGTTKVGTTFVITFRENSHDGE